jgi:hypothetical protein
MQWGMATVPSLTHCYFVSFNETAPRDLRLWIKRVERDERYIKVMEEKVQDFVRKLEAKINELNQLLQRKV